MSLDSRLTRLAPALSAQERAILILEAWKDGRPGDPSWRHTMPSEQSTVFNRYIELMNRANVVLGRMVSVLHMQVEALEQREAWLFGITLWLEHIDEIRRAIRLSLQEPITEAEHRARLEAARDEWVPLQELAEFLAAERDDYADDDYEDDEGDGLVIKDEPWARAVAEEAQRLRSLAAEGRVKARGKGRSMKLQHRALQLLGHDVQAVSEDYFSYRVLPDDQAEEVERERQDLRRLQQVVEWQPYFGPVDQEFGKMPERMREGLRLTTAHRLASYWGQLAAVDALVAEIGEAFNGIDPWRPVFREKMDTARDKLLTIKEHLLLVSLDVVLPEPTPEELDEMRGWLEEIQATS